MKPFRPLKATSSWDTPPIPSSRRSGRLFSVDSGIAAMGTHGGKFRRSAEDLDQGWSSEFSNSDDDISESYISHTVSYDHKFKLNLISTSSFMA